MKTWIIEGRWKNKNTGDMYKAIFKVRANNDDSDPLIVLNDIIDLSNMEYINGQIYLDYPRADQVEVIEPFNLVR